MKFSAIVKIACVAAAIGLAGAASAATLPLTNTPTGPTLLAGDIGSITPTFETTPFTTDWFFHLNSPGAIGGDVTSLDLSVPSVGNYQIVGITAQLIDTTTAMIIPTVGSSFALSNLMSGNYELIISGTPVGTLGGIFSGVVAVSAVPLPSAVWLLLSGVVGVVAMARRRGRVQATTA